MAVVWVLWLGHASAFGDYWIFVLALRVSWYWVALNVDSWRRDRTVLTQVPLRLAAALLLIAMGAFWGLTMASEVLDVLFPYWHWSGWLWPSGILGLLLAWSISSSVFFGRDFIHCVRSNQPVQ
jgi:hypothetical protein